jgi:hypothetical protein
VPGQPWPRFRKPQNRNLSGTYGITCAYRKDLGVGIGPGNHKPGWPAFTEGRRRFWVLRNRLIVAFLCRRGLLRVHLQHGQVHIEA